MNDKTTSNRLAIQTILNDYTTEIDTAQNAMTKAFVNGEFRVDGFAFAQFTKRRVNAMIDATNKLMKLNEFAVTNPAECKTPN